MLSIGEFSNICKVSTKTLRYYDEIGLLTPSEINPENGYRYYAIEQLETMLFINRLKSYSFLLEEIKAILRTKTSQDDRLYLSFLSIGSGRNKRGINAMSTHDLALYGTGQEVCRADFRK